MTDKTKNGEADEFDQLNAQIETTLSNLKKKRDLLQDQISQFETIQKDLEKSNDPTPIKFQLDNGEVIQKNKEESLDFIAKRISEIKSALTEFNTKINEGTMTQEKLSQFNNIIQKNATEDNLKEEKLNEEGLPFLDIQEELDDEGNVMNVKINDKAVENVEPKIEVLEEEHKTAENDHLQSLLEDMEIISKDGDKSKELNFDQDELLEKIDQLNISAEDKFKLKQVCVEEFKKLEEDDVPVSDKETHITNPAIDTNNLLELELIADDFDDSVNNVEDEEDEFDYDFDDDEDDDDDDDDLADELLYGGGKAKIIGDDEKSNDMLWNQIMKLREEKLKVNDNVVDDDESKNKKKAVRFAENLDIKEVENISDSLKNPPPAPAKRSLFKQNRESRQDKREPEFERSEIMSDVVEKDDVMYDVVEKDDIMSDIVEKEDIMSDVVEKDDVMSDVVEKEEFVGDITENNVLEPTIIEQTTRKPKSPSRFRSMRSSKSEPAKIPVPSDPVESELIPEPQNDSLSLSDLQNMQSDMDQMVRAYMEGKYDDDIETEGPVVNELKDFEHLNEIVESRNKDIIGVKDYDVNSNEIGMEEQIDDSDDDDDQIMVDEIIENENNDFEDFDENSFLDQEVRDNYHKLRNKLILDKNGFKKSQQELEMEPIDEYGNPVKISRFKAAKMNR